MTSKNYKLQNKTKYSLHLKQILKKNSFYPKKTTLFFRKKITYQISIKFKLN